MNAYEWFYLVSAPGGNFHEERRFSLFFFLVAIFPVHKYVMYSEHFCLSKCVVRQASSFPRATVKEIVVCVSNISTG